MRYELISSKFEYYLGVLIAVAMTISMPIAISLINFQSEDGFSLFIILLVLSIGVLYILYVNTSKNVYASVDLKNKKFLFGNIFFSQELSTDEVRVIGKKAFSRNVYKIGIHGKTYFLMSRNKNIRELLAMVIGSNAHEEERGAVQ